MLRLRSWIARGPLALALAGALAVTATGPSRADAGEAAWTGSWEGAAASGGPSFTDRTVRMVVHTTAGGQQVRLRLTNRYGQRPLAIGAVDVAVRESGARAVPGTHRTVTFGRKGKATVPAGAELVSDPVPFRAEAEQDLLVSVYLPKDTGPSTYHLVASEAAYSSTEGDHTGENGAANYTTETASWYFLDAVDVLDTRTRGTLVAFGDSITDGYSSTPGTNTRWPNVLAHRLSALPGGPRYGVVNAGISGNRVLSDALAGHPETGDSALRRFAHDALAEPRVRAVVLLEGANDIGLSDRPLPAQELINGYKTLIAQAHRANVRIYGGTILPFRGSFYGTPANEAVRQEVNRWILTGGAFDDTIDFASAVADPADPQRLRAAYDSGDHVHPNSAGYEAMGDAVPLAAFS
ncbi:SGNH/GDSL hydrolase family protein [Streptomyces luteireticuli]|uniref:SGNH/GDSL hydrolase family protein n=1 Tax=Streptomyces luteireticuli TaxID=173858 RepID=UPI003557AF25